MSGVVGVVCPELQDSLLKAFAEVDPPNSRVCGEVPAACCMGEIDIMWRVYKPLSPTMELFLSSICQPLLLYAALHQSKSFCQVLRLDVSVSMVH